MIPEEYEPIFMAGYRAGLAKRGELARVTGLDELPRFVWVLMMIIAFLFGLFVESVI